ncbi:MAG: decaprenyl-phosphate phosphoribosyltransferase [Phycisphaerales bacterium]|nr:decaprenyl-phosphate phosphoribosyltransferase [Phycisphaerales bacterium]
MPYLRLMRPEQWSKNVFLFAGLVFGQRLTDSAAVVTALLGFGCFCLVSSAVYIFNDIRDRQEDRLHPRKRTRPVAAGQVTPASAGLLAALLLGVGLLGAWQLDWPFFLTTSAYLVVQAFYTYGLKQVALLDVILIGIGFVLRAIAGAVVVNVEISPWLVICTFTLCLFMGFSKRRCELAALAEQADDAVRHRRTLGVYTPELLNHMTTVTAGIAVVSFLLYATDDKTVVKFQTEYLAYTLPLVVYAVFRFALLVEHGRVDGPTAVLVRDRPFQAAIALWSLAVVLIIYRGAWLEGVLKGNASGAG